MLEVRVGERPFLCLLSTDERNDRTAEIHGEMPIVENDFWRIGIAYHVDVALERDAERSNLSISIVKAMADLLDLALLDERFIALNIDDNVEITTDFLNGFLDSISATLMVWRSHDDVSAP